MEFPRQKCAANYIKLIVAPDGKRYTVTIPATGHTRTFETKARQAARGITGETRLVTLYPDKS